MEKLKILNLNFSFQRAAHYHINGGMLLILQCGAGDKA